MLISHKNLGILYIILGSGLIVLFSGHLLIRFLGTFFGFMILNYGLQLLHFASFPALIVQIFQELKSQVMRKK